MALLSSADNKPVSALISETLGEMMKHAPNYSKYLNCVYLLEMQHEFISMHAYVHTTHVTFTLISRAIEYI
jgi:hypothetical protein